MKFKNFRIAVILGIVGRNIFALAKEFFGAENLTGD